MIMMIIVNEINVCMKCDLYLKDTYLVFHTYTHPGGGGGGGLDISLGGEVRHGPSYPDPV